MPKASQLIAGALSEATPPVTIRKIYHPGGCGSAFSRLSSPKELTYFENEGNGVRETKQ